jgi:hypothetical protein
MIFGCITKSYYCDTGHQGYRDAELTVDTAKYRFQIWTKIIASVHSFEGNCL